MTGALTYLSLEEFEEDYIAAIREESEALASERAWWKDRLSVGQDEANPSLLKGTTRLMHRYITDPATNAARKVDYRDDVLMGMVDYLAIIEILTMLSKEHEFTWQVSAPAEPRDKLIGTIVDGEIDPRLFDFLIPELEALEIAEQDLENEILHQSIRGKYFGPAEGAM